MSTIKNLNEIVKQYILLCIDLSGYDEYKDLKSDEDKVRAVFAIFNKEYGHNIKGSSVQKAFVGWLEGLPSCFNVDFEDYRIIEIGKEWGFLGENSSERSEQKFIKEWFDRIYMNFKRLLK